MAMQAGMGVSRLLFIVGAGYGGTILMQNGKLSVILGELQKLVKNMDSGEGEGTDPSEAIAAQVRRLAYEVRKMADARQITVYGDSGQSILMSLAMPAAVVGALGYGYMRWKGIPIWDVMYVTKSNMTAAVANLKTHLGNVSEALAAAKRHLTQRIENLDGKLDDQVEVSKLLRNEVNDVRGDLSDIGTNLSDIQRMASGLDEKLLSLENKQDFANAGLMYLCGLVNGKKVKMPELIQDQLKIAGPTKMGLKELADILSMLADGNGQDASEKLNSTSGSKYMNVRSRIIDPISKARRSIEYQH